MSRQYGEAATSHSICAVYSSFTTKRILGSHTLAYKHFQVFLILLQTFQLPLLQNHIHRTAIYRLSYILARYMILSLSVYSITHLILTKHRSLHCLTAWRTMAQLRQLCQQAIWAVPEWYVFVILSPFFAHFHDQQSSSPSGQQFRTEPLFADVSFSSYPPLSLPSSLLVSATSVSQMSSNIETTCIATANIYDSQEI